jgi:MFS transporter, PPP family, 3-phenylpropionic acid transporter
VVSSPVAARAAYATLFGAVGASFPFLPVYYRSAGLSLGEVGLLTASAAAVGLVAAPLWGALADRYPRSRLVIPAAAAVAAVAAVALAFAREPIAIVAAAIAISGAMAGIPPVLDARALEIVADDHHRYSRLRVWGSISFVIVVWITGFVIERAGIASLFAVYVPLLGLTALVALLLRGSGRVAAPLPRLTGVGLVLGDPILRRFLMAALVGWAASMAINGFLSIHLLAIGAPGELVGTAWAIGAIVEIPIMWAYPWLAARFGTRSLLVGGAGALALRAVAISVLTHPVAAALTMLIHGAGFALLLIGGVTYVSRHAPSGAEATAQGVLTAIVFSLAMILGNGLGGLAAGALGLPAMFAISATIGVAAVVLLGVATAERPSPEPAR